MARTREIALIEPEIRMKRSRRMIVEQTDLVF